MAPEKYQPDSVAREASEASTDKTLDTEKMLSEEALEGMDAYTAEISDILVRCRSEAWSFENREYCVPQFYRKVSESGMIDAQVAMLRDLLRSNLFFCRTRRAGKGKWKHYFCAEVADLELPCGYSNPLSKQSWQISKGIVLRHSGEASSLSPLMLHLFCQKRIRRKAILQTTVGSLTAIVSKWQQRTVNAASMGGSFEPK